jgi:GT2 family glycosyltransferase
MSNEKIGVGIITFQPRKTFDKCFDFHHHMVDHVVVVNDGKEFDHNWSSGFRNKYVGRIPDTTLTYIKNKTNLGVGKSKNTALQHLLDQGCEHIFLIEDDIFIIDQRVFQAYIDASKKSGIQHFNFSQHGIMNKGGYTNIGKPNPNYIIGYEDGVNVSFLTHCVGAFSYYSRKCLEAVGLMDERYYNACEHVDHTYEIIKAGMHPPFWNFADIENSQDYLGDEPWTKQKSTISSRSDHQALVSDADKIFVEKHGLLPMQIPVAKEEEVYKSLKQIKKTYGFNNSDMQS